MLNEVGGTEYLSNLLDFLVLQNKLLIMQKLFMKCILEEN